MRLYQQLILFMLAATVLPLAGVGFWLLGDAQRALAERIASEQRALASAAAEQTEAHLLGAINGVARAAELIDWAHASADERRGGLTLLYQQSPAVAAVALVDGKGALLTQPVFSLNGGEEHPAFRDGDLATLTSAIPVETLRDGALGQAAMSRVYRSPSRGRPALAMAVKLAPGKDAPFALVELGLESLEDRLHSQAGQGQRLEIVDAQGRILASSDPRRTLHVLESQVAEVVRSHLGTAGAQSFSVPGWIGASMRMGDPLGFAAVVEADPAVALAPVLKMRREIAAALAVSLLVLLGMGLAFTRRLTRRLERVVAGAEAFGRGELESRIHLSGSDELTDLAETFNRMGEELHGARARLLRWNDDLKQKVEEATAELRAAQAQLVEAQKLAAVGQLGAGVAHEINNPLAGILGHTQLLLLDRNPGDSDFEALRKIEQSAKRCKEITQNLLRFSQQRDRPELRPIDLNAVVRDAISLSENQLKGEGISLELALSDTPVRVSGDPGHLAQLVLAFISNARTAMAKSATKVLRIRTAAGGQAALAVEDTGKGIAPENLPRIFEPFFTTKDVWSNVGLGLSVAYRIASEHQGRIEVATEVGKGSCFTFSLPVLAERASGAVRAPAVQAR